MQRYNEVDVFQLIEELNKYSEQGTEYTDLLKKIIEWNDLQKFDEYYIDPDYIITDTVIERIVNQITDFISN